MTEQYCLAGITVSASFSGAYLRRQCAAYKAAPDSKADFTVEMTPGDIEYEKEQDSARLRSDGYYESLAFYRKFCEHAATRDCMLFHGSAIAVNGTGYLFGAPSGTGKSTHARLYRETFGDAVRMINDDKPLLRRSRDGFLVCGTPWDGKHHLSSNLSVPLKGICFLKQGKDNRIRRLSVPEALMAALGQIYRPKQEEALRNVLAMTQTLVTELPVFELYCTISEEAVQLSFDTMRGNGES